jgi:hypothetical protein
LLYDESVAEGRIGTVRLETKYVNVIVSFVHPVGVTIVVAVFGKYVSEWGSMSWNRVVGPITAMPMMLMEMRNSVIPSDVAGMDRHSGVIEDCSAYLSIRKSCRCKQQDEACV